MQGLFEECRERISAQEVAVYYGGHIEHGKMLCPFHGDVHPSMSFKNGCFRCWACGAAGDAVNYVSKLFGLSQIEALQKINADFNLALPIDRPPTREERKKAEKRQAITDMRQQYEAWRFDMLKQLNSAYRIGHRALMEERGPTEAEALAIRWREALEAWADALDSADMETQMEIFRMRTEVEQLCKTILSDSAERSKTA